MYKIYAKYVIAAGCLLASSCILASTENTTICKIVNVADASHYPTMAVGSTTTNGKNYKPLLLRKNKAGAWGEVVRAMPNNGIIQSLSCNGQSCVATGCALPVGQTADCSTCNGVSFTLETTNGGKTWK